MQDDIKPKSALITMHYTVPNSVLFYIVSALLYFFVVKSGKKNAVKEGKSVNKSIKSCIKVPDMVGNSTLPGTTFMQNIGL